jgi:hypothetical protein
VSAPGPTVEPPPASPATPATAASYRTAVREPAPVLTFGRHVRAGLVFLVIMILFAGVAYPLGIATLGWGVHSGPSTTPSSSAPPANNSTGNSTTNDTSNSSVAVDVGGFAAAPGGGGLRPVGIGPSGTGLPRGTAIEPAPQTFEYPPRVPSFGGPPGSHGSGPELQTG